MDEELQRPAQISLCVVLFLLLAVYNLVVAVRHMPPTGDEPHYLLVAHSLAYDSDLSLLNNYQARHYRAFYPGDLPKRTTPSADGLRELPAEGLGLSLLLAAPYRFAREVLPTSWTVPFLRILMCSITIIVLYLLLSGLIAVAAPSSSWIFAATAFLCSPLLFYSGQLYPEMPAALCIAAALLAWLELEEHPQRGLWTLALLPGILVWLHPKYVALSLAILAFSAMHFHRTFRVYKEWKTKARIALLLAVGFAGILSFFLFLRAEYGGWSPNRIYAGWEPQQQKTLWELVVQGGFARITVMIRMFFGFWLDQRFGLLVFAPLYIAFLPALVHFFRMHREIAVGTSLLFGIHFLSLCWGAPLGGFAPPSRHLVVLLPLLLFPILLLVEHWKKHQRFLYIGLIGLSVLISLQMMTHYRMIFTNLTWRNPDGRSPFWENWGLSWTLPTFTAQDLPWLSIIAALLVTLTLALFLRVPNTAAIEPPVEEPLS